MSTNETILTFSLSIIINVVIALWAAKPATNESILFVFSLSILIQSVFVTVAKIYEVRGKRRPLQQTKKSSEVDFHKRLDLNLSRAENALNLIRYVLTADLSEDLRQCLQYCEEVLVSSYDEMHVPQALLQLPPHLHHADDDSMHTAGGDGNKAVLQWLRAQHTSSKSAMTLAQALMARSDCVTIADLGCTVQDWLLTEFSHCAAPLPHSAEEPTTPPAVPGPASELAGAEDGFAASDSGSPTAEALRRAAGRRWRRSSFCDARLSQPPLIGFGPVADDDGLGGGTGRIADLEPAVHAQEHPAEEGAGRAGAANVTSPARPPPQRAVLPLQPMAATATVAAKPAKSFGPGVRCSANA